MKKEIVKSLKKQIDLPSPEIENLIEIPPSSLMGDFAFPCFSLSKKLRQSPQQIANNLKSKLNLPKGFSNIEAFGGYLNFFLDRKSFSESLIKDILKKENDFGKKIRKKRKIMIEFSQPNTHKAFHIGHVRGTSLGESLARIMEFCGDKVIRVNYSGDTGMHIARWIWCYNKYHSKEKLRNDEKWISSIYVESMQRLSENKDLQKEVDEINKKIENKSDEKINKLWDETRKLSINSWKKIYKELNTFFDIHYFESEVEKRGKEITQELLKKKIAKKSDGAIIIDFEKYNLGVLVFLRKDGTVLYAGKDLALAERKIKENADEYLYIVADEQSMYFKQIFKTLELMRFRDWKKFKHLAFGMVRFPYGKMSSRTGENILYSDFIKELKDYAIERIKEHSINSPNKDLEDRALKISIAAVKYSMLKQNQNKNIIFKKEDSLNFEGDTGPYLLYSYARASSIIRKSGKFKKNFKIKEIEPIEFELVKKLSDFPEIVLNSYENYNPSVIANYSYELSRIFNEFYHKCPVISSNEKDFRMNLVNSFRIILKNSLFLLGIDVLEEM